MPETNDVRVPPTVTPETAVRGRAALEEARQERDLALGALRRIARSHIDDPMARAAQHTAVTLLQIQIEALIEGLEIVLGKREPSATERAGQ